MAIPWVVKLGGSLAESPELPQWLGVLASQAVIIVPGGGPFANTVRAAQDRWHFDDSAAHHMAILGMAQYGLMLCGMNPRLCAKTDWRQLHCTFDNGITTVWLPDPFSLANEDIETNWEVTSDSLALWLAIKLGVSRLLLVKSAEPPKGETSVTELATLGLVDAAFPGVSQTGHCEIWVCGPEASLNLDSGLLHPANCFSRATTH